MSWAKSHRTKTMGHWQPARILPHALKAPAPTNRLRACSCNVMQDGRHRSSRHSDGAAARLVRAAADEVRVEGRQERLCAAVASSQRTTSSLARPLRQQVRVASTARVSQQRTLRAQLIRRAPWAMRNDARYASFLQPASAVYMFLWQTTR